ncbi:hypothetical protein KSP40_PGU014940 [Platanthera guangdongensis]|uniref:Uncharacterized protein n=1 Tax=Platanthera guangdongensis TaxID=2320717 RepID=A0ABR2M7I9_9ASPA
MAIPPPMTLRRQDLYTPGTSSRASSTRRSRSRSQRGKSRPRRGGSQPHSHLEVCNPTTLFAPPNLLPAAMMADLAPPLALLPREGVVQDGSGGRAGDDGADRNPIHI